MLGRLPLWSLLAFAAGSALAQPGAPAKPEPEGGGITLHILHVGDTHSRLDPVDAFGATCTEEEAQADACFGGAARLHAAIEARRAEIEATGEPVLVLHAGDQFQGSLFFSAYGGEAEVEFMNEAGFDAMVLGNHEFDLGPAALASFVRAAEFPVLFGNVDAQEDDRLGALHRDSAVLELDGVTVGIVAAVAPDAAETSMPGPTIAFGDPLEHLAAAAGALEAEGVEHVIALTHVGAPTDIEIAETVPGIDAIVGAHTHTLFSNTAEAAAYPYPYLVEGPAGRPVPIVHAGAYTQHLGHLVLRFDAAGNVTEARGEAVLLDASVEPDPDVLARVDALRAPIEELMRQVVASVAAPADGSRETCRVEECAMGNLVAEAMLERVADQGIDVAIVNAGGLRASLDAGEVTMGDIVAVLPFQNTLATFELTGENVVAALENGVSQVEEGSGRFPQVAGLRFAWDPEAPPGDRVAEVEVRDGDDWVPIDPARSYGVASNNFLRGGGDGYVVFRDGAINPYDFGPNLEAVLAEYLTERPGYQPHTDGRIRRVE